MSENVATGRPPPTIHLSSHAEEYNNDKSDSCAPLGNHHLEGQQFVAVVLKLLATGGELGREAE